MIRSVLGKASLLLLGLCSALLVGEIATRMLERWPAPTSPPAPPPDRSLPEIHSVFELAQPNQRAIHVGKFYRTNSAGFRGPEYSKVPARGTFRIVVVGDSVTMGSGVLEEETYSAVLETMLNAEQDGRRYEVLNMGISGANALQVAYRLGGMGLPFNPDVVVYGFTLNDIEGPHYVRYSSGELGAWHSRLRSRFDGSASHLLSAAWPRLVSLADVLFHLKGSYEYELQQNYFHNPAAWDDLLAQLDVMADLGRRNGICVHVLLHTTPHYLGPMHPFRKIYDAVAAAVVARGMTVTDAYRESFHGHDASQLVLSPFDPHPNAAGHRLLAEALYAGLERLPPRCWERAASRGSAPQPPA